MSLGWRAKWLRLAAVLILVLGAQAALSGRALAAEGAPQAEKPQGGLVQALEDISSSIDVSGNIIWTASYAWGDPEGLKGTSYVLDDVVLKQQLRLVLSGELAEGVLLSAVLSNYDDDDVHIVEVSLERDGLKGRFGDFRLTSTNPYVVYNTSLRGLELYLTRKGLSGGVVFARVQGIPATKVFKAGLASELITYVDGGPYSPEPNSGGLTASSEGLFYYAAMGEFDDDLMSCAVRYGDPSDGSATRTLGELFDAYELGYLYKESDADDGVLQRDGFRELAAGSFVHVVPPAELGHGYVILRSHPYLILRNQIKALIAEYNQAHGLSGADAERYPFVEGSDTESQFLSELYEDHTWLIAIGVDGEPDAGVLDAGLASYRSSPGWPERRFYDLGRTDAEFGTVEVQLAQGHTYTSADLVAGLSYTVFHQEGLIELRYENGIGGGTSGDDPDALFSVYDLVRVSYKYRITGQVYALGISVAQGSEKVYVNDRLLERDKDYTIDYQAGIISLLCDVQPEDTVKIDYEYYRGGLGVFTEYQTNFYGGSLAWDPSGPLSLRLDVLRSQDVGEGLVESERARTMPNTHTVVGLSGKYDGKAVMAGFDLAYSHDVFPHDDNGRVHQPNEVTDILADRDSAGVEYVIFAHRNGLTAYNGTLFRSYGVGQGLAGWTVYDIASSDGGTDGYWYFATESGLTRLSKYHGAAGPFDWAANWERYYTSSGLPASQVLSVLVTPGGFSPVTTATGNVVWAGTTGGLAWAAEDGLESGGIVWTVADKSTNPEMIDEVVRALCQDPVTGDIYVGTENGLMVFDGFSFTTLIEGTAVNDIAVTSVPVPSASALVVFVATDEGIRYFEAGAQSPNDVRAFEDGPAGSPVTSLVHITDVSGVSGGSLWFGTLRGAYVSAIMPGEGQDPIALGVPQPVSGTEEWAVTAVRRQVHPDGAPAEASVWMGSAGKDIGGDVALMLWRMDPGGGSAESWDSEASGIDGEDQHRYQDIAEDGHTAVGYAGTVSGRYSAGSATVSASYQRIEPGFLPIGRRSRQDLEVWSVDGSYKVASYLTFSAGHSVRTSAQVLSPSSSGYPTTTATDRAVLDLSYLLDVGLEYSLQRTEDHEQWEGYDKERRAYVVSAEKTLFGDSLRLSASYENVDYSDLVREANSYAAHNVVATASYRFGRELFLDMNYRRPLKVAGVGPGQQETGLSDLTWSVKWYHGFSTGRLSASYTDFSRTRIPSGDEQGSASASVYFDAKSGSLAGARVTPRAGLRWSTTAPAVGSAYTTISGDGSVTVSGDEWWGRLRAEASKREYPGLDKSTLQRAVSGSFSYTALDRITPSLDFGWTVSDVDRPDLGRKTTETARAGLTLKLDLLDNFGLVLRAGWKSAEEATKLETVLSAGASASYAVSSRCTLSLGGGWDRTTRRTGGEDGTSESVLRLSTGFRWAVNSTWSLTADAGLIHGVPANPLEEYTTYTLTLGVRADL